jgi:hypothetical protein
VCARLFAWHARRAYNSSSIVLGPMKTRQRGAEETEKCGVMHEGMGALSVASDRELLARMPTESVE